MHLESQRLTYVKFTRNDLPNYMNLVTQEEVMKHITGVKLNPEQAIERFQVALDTNEGQEDMGFLAVAEKESGSFIGLGKIVPFENGITEIGYALLPQFWGKGYASEITTLLIEYARKLGNVDELIGLVNPQNEGSIRVLTKHGFVFCRDIISADNVPRADYLLKIR